MGSDGSGYGAEGERPAWLTEHLEVKDWVVIKPGAAHATAPGALPVGSWVGGDKGLLHIAEDSLLKVPREVSQQLTAPSKKATADMWLPVCAWYPRDLRMLCHWLPQTHTRAARDSAWDWTTWPITQR